MPVKPEHDITSPRAEREFERKAEQEFRGQRELPNGRNFLWNSFRAKSRDDLKSYRSNYDLIKWGTSNKNKEILMSVDAP